MKATRLLAWMMGFTLVRDADMYDEFGPRYSEALEHLISLGLVKMGQTRINHIPYYKLTLARHPGY